MTSKTILKMPVVSYQQIENTKIAYYDSSNDKKASSKKPTLVLIHGLSSSSDTWKDVYKTFAKKHRVIAIDLLGHGNTSSNEDYSLENNANLIIELLNHLNVTQADFVGHSLGGGIIMQIAYIKPEIVQRLILVSSGGLGPEVSRLLSTASLPAANYILPVLFWKWPSKLKELEEKETFNEKSLIKKLLTADLKEFSASMEVFSQKEKREAFLKTLREVVDNKGQKVTALDKLHLLANFPTLLIWGELDLIIPLAHAKNTLLKIPHAKLEIFEKTGHLPHRSNPEKFNETVEDFILKTNPANITKEHFSMIHKSAV